MVPNSQARLLPIKFRYKKDNKRENFQSAQEHTQDKNPFAQSGDHGVMIGWTDAAEPVREAAPK